MGTRRLRNQTARFFAKHSLHSVHSDAAGGSTVLKPIRKLLDVRYLMVRRLVRVAKSIPFKMRLGPDAKRKAIGAAGRKFTDGRIIPF
jgi:hypothetical protein